jgi:pimeloyl-ACP methyl ester carboxylesterase
MELDVVFRNHQGLKLIGTLSTPESDEPCPIVILVHGFLGNKENGFFPLLAAALVSRGIAVLRFDARGCGKSEGEEHPTYKTLVEDVQAAVDYVKTQGRFSAIGLAGHSMGGTAVIEAAAKTPGVKAFATFAAVAHPGRSAEKKHEFFTTDEDGLFTMVSHDRTYRFSERFFTDAEATTPLATLQHQLLRMPKLFFHGTADDRIGIEEAEELFLAAASPKAIEKMEGADHSFKGHTDALIAETLAFFTAHLR